MLRNPADIRSLGLLSAVLCLEIGAIVYYHKIPALLLPPVWILLAFAVFTATLINHNHRHLCTFDNAWLNRTLNCLLTVAIGAPSTRLHAIHTYNHHKEYRTTDDWAHYSLAGSGRGVRRVLSYYARAALRIARMRKTLPMSPQESRELRIEYAVLFLWLAAWLAFDALPALVVLVPAWLGGQMILLIANLVNHDYCDLESPYDLARNFHSRIENWVFLNNGFHTAHHRRTSLHWSKLREVHESHFSDKCDPDLQSNSFLAYFFRHYLLGQASNSRSGHRFRK